MFKIGDEVEVCSDKYNWTVRGSRGYVIGITSSDQVEVEFTYCPDLEMEEAVIGAVFDIIVSRLQLISSDPLYKLNKKIKAIGERHLMKCR